MAERAATEPTRAPNDVDFHRWVLDRQRGRSNRITWLLLALLVGALSVIAVLLAQPETEVQSTRDSSEYAAIQQQLEDLDQKIRKLAVTFRTNDRVTAKTLTCLQDRTYQTRQGMRQLLAEQISVRTFLRRYKSTTCP